MVINYSVSFAADPCVWSTSERYHDYVDETGSAPES